MTTLLQKRRRRMHNRQHLPHLATNDLSPAERYMRVRLREDHGIDPNDDRAVHDYIARLLTPSNDARSLWEKRIQARIARELGIS